MSKVKERVVSGNTYGFHIATTVAMLAYFNFDLWIGFGYAYATFLTVSTIGMFMITFLIDVELKNAKFSPTLVIAPNKIKLVGEVFDALMKKTNFYIFTILLTEVLMATIAFKQQEYFLASAYVIQCIGYILMIDRTRSLYRIWENQGYINAINWTYEQMLSGVVSGEIDEKFTFTEELVNDIETIIANQNKDE